MELDPHTLLVMIVVTSLAAVLALAIVAPGHRVAGLWSLAGAVLCLALTFTIFGLYQHVPPLFGVVITNGALSLLMSLLLLAIVQLRSRRIQWLWVAAPPVATLVVSALLPHTARVLMTDAICALQGVILISALTRDGGIGVGRGRHILFASMVALVLLYGSRLLAMATGLVDVPPDQPNIAPIDTLSYVAAYLIMVFTLLGFVLATAEITADQNHRLALQDVLTGLPNRRAMLDSLARHWYAAVRSERALTLLMVDIDHFKLINDRHGHPAGDAVLRQVSRLMRSRLRAQDQVGRFGGEEFMVILPETTPEGAQALAEMLRAEIAGMVLRTRGKTLSATVSIGKYTIWPTETDTIPEFIRRADDALYRAKAAGRNRVTSA